MQFLKSLMKTSSLGMKLWLVSGIRSDELIQGLLKSSRSSHEEVGIQGWEAKGTPFLLFSNNSHSAQCGQHCLAVHSWGSQQSAGVQLGDSSLLAKSHSFISSK